MKALLCRELAGVGALRVEEVADPEPQAGEVRVAVHAAGVNFPDVLLVQGKYQYKAPLPFAPGFELAGTVEKVGAGVAHVQAGDLVLAIVPHGAFAQKAIAPARSTMKLPAQVDLELAAAMMFTYGTSLHALQDRGELKAGETLLVLGAAGGVGLAAVELAKLMGARVIAAASSAEKLAVCREHGADETIDYAKEDLRERIKAMTAGQGVDVVYDPVGGAYTEPALRSLAWKGRLLVVGFAAGDIPKIPMNLPLLKGCSIVGVYWGAFLQKDAARAADNARRLVEWLAAGRIRPHISARYPLQRGAEALREVEERRAKGKVLVLP
jgi:NADPH2:quinone reductase